ncbi:MAG: hypothetical protein IT179_13585 [Acidobacteria bacterium]|nr:hypothetical protein [Acidobacteriota bacterium]
MGRPVVRGRPVRVAVDVRAVRLPVLRSLRSPLRARLGLGPRHRSLDRRSGRRGRPCGERRRLHARAPAGSRPGACERRRRRGPLGRLVRRVELGRVELGRLRRREHRRLLVGGRGRRRPYGRATSPGWHQLTGRAGSPQSRRVIDSVQLTAKHKVATPANWEPGQDVTILTSVSDGEAPQQYPQDRNALKPRLRVVPQPRG